MAVCFVDIVGYTTQSKSLEEDALVEWIEGFEQVATGTVVDHGGRVIKTIGDEILFTADDPAAAAEIALALAERGLDEDDRSPPSAPGSPTGCRQPARRRVRPHGQHRGPTHLGRPARHRRPRPRAHAALTGAGADGEDADGRPRRDQDADARACRLPLPAAAPRVGEGLHAARGLAGQAPEGRLSQNPEPASDGKADRRQRDAGDRRQAGRERQTAGRVGRPGIVGVGRSPWPFGVGVAVPVGVGGRGGGGRRWGWPSCTCRTRPSRS